jgi:hypothetical protein
MLAASLNQPSGDVHLSLIKGGESKPISLREIISQGLPQRGLPDEVNEYRVRNARHLWRGARTALLARKLGIPTMYGALHLDLIRGGEEIVPLGLVSLRVVTTAGVDKLVAAMNQTDAATFPVFRFHGFGTGGAAEAAANTALTTELTTQYAVDNTRPTGSQTVGGSNNIYRSVATFSPDSGGTIAVTEHGLFSQAATGGGTLWDRTLFSVVNVVAASDSIQATYDATFAAGS